MPTHRILHCCLDQRYMMADMFLSFHGSSRIILSKLRLSSIECLNGIIPSSSCKTSSKIHWFLTNVFVLLEVVFFLICCLCPMKCWRWRLCLFVITRIRVCAARYSLGLPTPFSMGSSPFAIELVSLKHNELFCLSPNAIFWQLTVVSSHDLIFCICCLLPVAYVRFP